MVAMRTIIQQSNYTKLNFEIEWNSDSMWIESQTKSQIYIWKGLQNAW